MFLLQNKTKTDYDFFFFFFKFELTLFICVMLSLLKDMDTHKHMHTFIHAMRKRLHWGGMKRQKKPVRRIIVLLLNDLPVPCFCI